MPDLKKPLSTTAKTMNSSQNQIVVAAASALSVILIATSFPFPYLTLSYTNGSLKIYYAKATEETSSGTNETGFNKINRVLITTIFQFICSIALSLLALYKIQQDRKRKLILSTFLPFLLSFGLNMLFMFLDKNNFKTTLGLVMSFGPAFFLDLTSGLIQIAAMVYYFVSSGNEAKNALPTYALK